jgi:SOS response regulatory protein OraA/RecX
MEYGDFRRAAMGYLARRGFGYDVITEVLERLWAELSPSADDG